MRQLILAATVAALSCVGAAADEKQAGNEITVTGKDSPHQWVFGTDSTKDHVMGTKVGDPVNRMTIPVTNGDVVAFVVTQGGHRVLFENAKQEQAGGIWEVMPDSGTLTKLPDGKLPNFDHDQAMCSMANTGNLIKIRILQLPKGQAILFGCNPHSDTQADVIMVGALVGK
jgi:hypothetical protein